jgi:hypothetical protein
LVLVPSSFFSIGAPAGGWSAGAFISPPGAGAAGVSGAAGAAGAGAGGGGGGGAGSSFLPHPAKVSIKAKRAVPENKTILFPIPKFTSFPDTADGKPFLLDNFLLHNSCSLARAFYPIAKRHTAVSYDKRIKTQKLYYAVASTLPRFPKLN